MNPEMTVEQALQAWLSSDDCLPWLHVQALAILGRAGDLGLPAQLWPHGRPGEMSAGEMEAAKEEVAHEFWLYLRSQMPGRSQSWPPELTMLAARPSVQLAAYLRHGFLSRLRSLGRRKGTSLYHYLYRRVRETVAQGAGFHHRVSRWGVLYSLQAQGPSLGSLAGLVPAPYQDWASPAALVAEKDLLRCRLEDLRRLAELFWRQAVDRIGHPCYLPCRELVAYLAAHYQCLQAGASDLLEDLAAPRAYAAQARRSGLEALARQVREPWSAVRRQVFGLALDPGDLTLLDVAQRTGLSSPSHVKYHLDRACEDIAKFCETWPGAVPPPTEREFWGEFLQCVGEACKNPGQGRYKRQ